MKLKKFRVRIFRAISSFFIYIQVHAGSLTKNIMLEKGTVTKKCDYCKKESQQEYLKILDPHSDGNNIYRLWPGEYNTAPEDSESNYYLDYRPVDEEAYQATMQYIEQCPHCGLCVYDIRKPIRPHHIRLEPYQKILSRMYIPEQARRHMCLAFICLKSGAFYVAAKHMLFASWICDDYNKKKLADKCRAIFLKMFKTGSISPQGNFDFYREPLYFIFIDTLRRLKRFDLTGSYLYELIDERQVSQNYKHLYLFQRHLYDKKNSSNLTFNHLKKYIKKINEPIPEKESDSYQFTEVDYDELYFDAMTDGQYGDYDKEIDLDDLADRLGH